MFIIVVSLLMGCESKTRSCRSLVETMNAHQPQISQAREALSQGDASALASFERTVGEAQRAIGGLELPEPQVQTYAEQYVDLLGKAIDVGKGLAPGTDQPTARWAEEAQAVVKAENELVSALNTYCASR